MKNKLITLAKSQNIDVEILENEVEFVNIATLNDKLKTFNISNTIKYTIKAIKDGRSIKFYVESIKKPERILDNILEMFRVQENKNANTLCQGNLKHKLNKKEHLDYEKIKKDLLSLNDLKKEYPEISSIETSYDYVLEKYKINNSACSLEDETYYHCYGAVITVKKNNINKAVYINYFTNNYDFEESKSFINNKLKSLLIKLDSESVKTKKYRVLLTNYVVADILDCFVGAFHSKNIELKTSVLSDKFNHKIFNEKISIIEDPEKGISPRYFDTEGVKTKYKELVKDGVFVSKINNMEYALKLKEEATGNSYGVNNLYVKPGSKSYDNLVSELKDGIIIDEGFGFHTGVDTQTGNISIQCQGLLVENGKVTKGLEMIILQTNFFEVFNNVVSLGNDLSKTLTSVSAPSMILENITIAGKK